MDDDSRLEAVRLLTAVAGRAASRPWWESVDQILIALERAWVADQARPFHQAMTELYSAAQDRGTDAASQPTVPPPPPVRDRLVDLIHQIGPK
ncbi:CATRA system-associated protein [Frankia gtarii]|uniref:CATRA system-associated protein n=1 Tax=Frankia gtarii TaxID=2950102 RepID=UPI0021C010A1|nr:CATRA system-associated protein [Frankia gtarii]